jgi:hypothetical protein
MLDEDREPGKVTSEYSFADDSLTTRPVARGAEPFWKGANMELYMGLAITTVVGSWAASFLGAYLKKKGENLATHEDINKLVDQVSAVTTATKEIESKITSDVWDRQKRWELKREVLFETTKRIAIARSALTHLCAVYTTEKASKEKGQPERLEKRIEVGAEWTEAANELDQATSLVALACGPEVQKAVHAFAIFAGDLAEEITQGRPEAFTTSTKELVSKADANQHSDAERDGNCEVHLASSRPRPPSRSLPGTCGQGFQNALIVFGSEAFAGVLVKVTSASQ